MIKRIKTFFKNLKNNQNEAAMKAGYGWAWGEFVIGGMNLKELEAKASGFENNIEAFDKGIELALDHMKNRFNIQSDTDINAKPKISYVPCSPSGVLLYELSSNTEVEAQKRILKRLNNAANYYKKPMYTWDRLAQLGYTIEPIQVN